MICLAIDTSTTLCSVAVVADTTILAEVSLGSAKKHSETVLLLVDRMMNETGLTVKDIDVFGVSTGPGSFTGLRVGISVAKGLSFSAGRKLAGISLFEVLACQAAGYGCAVSVSPMIDAGKGEVYAGLYRYCAAQGLEQEIRATVTCPRKWLEEIKHVPAVFVGSGAVVYRDDIDRIHGADHAVVPEIIGVPRSSTIAFLTLKMYDKIQDNAVLDVSPLYIRPPDAETGTKKIKPDQ